MKNMLKTKAKISALRSFIDCEISEINKKVNSFSETLNQILKDLEKMQKRSYLTTQGKHRIFKK